MFANTKTIGRLVGSAAVVGIAGLGLIGCSTSDTVTPDPTSIEATTTPATSYVPSKSKSAEPSTSKGRDGIAIEGGPRVPPPASVPADRVVPDVPGTKCGATQGPDGSLELVILKGKIKCADAKAVAEQYGPKIATGQKQTVNGWTCGPSEAENILAACAKGDDAFVFQIPN
ncbi:MAG: hypothetical protein QM728_00980 [Gordonia sp. (in: high G+C Gram-positive bacteria)]|uniref:hypothetical protein n=1 Tax=Gordonia sp. (in: high G+C Gram-positive bacteria) TaxID=84139 RepID=UPI0039E40F3C